MGNVDDDRMQLIGKYFSREVYWLDYAQFSNRLPDKDWVCLMTANSEPNEKQFDEFTRKAIAMNILEFKGHGKYGELLHDWFDETMVIMETMENHSEIEVMTTWHNNESLADAFWQCFFATCLPESTDFDNVKVICSDLDSVNRIEELKGYIERFENGWLPPD